MNCKPGDLAVMVRSDMPRNVGSLVEVLHADYPNECGPVWRCRTLSHMENSWGRLDPPGAIGRCDDRDLRPLRDGDGVDETLRILEKTE